MLALNKIPTLKLVKRAGAFKTRLIPRGDVYPAEFDGTMIGPDGAQHFYPAWLFEQLKRMDDAFKRSSGGRLRLLRRDDGSGLWAIQREAVTLLLPLWELPAFNPRAKVRAIDPEYQNGRPHGSGRRGLIDLLMTGLPADRREMDDCAEDLDRTRLPGRNPIDQAEAARIVRDVKAKRNHKTRR